MLFRSTDSIAGANYYLKVYMGRTPSSGDTDFMFPCQFVYDEGLCVDTVLQGLCAHSCTPLIAMPINGNITIKYQDVNLDIDYASAGLTEPGSIFRDYDNKNNSVCTGDNDAAAFAFIKNHVGSHHEGLAVKGPR